MFRVNHLVGFGSGRSNMRLRPPSPSNLFWRTVFTDTLDGDTNGWDGFNQRHVFVAPVFSAGGSIIRVTLQGGSDSGITYDSLWIGEQASSGDIYDMKASAPAPAQLLVNGSGSFAVASSDLVVTDPLTFTIDTSKSYVISSHYSDLNGFSQLASGIGAMPGGTGSGSYYLSPQSADESSTANVTGYSGAGSTRGIKKIEVVTTDDIFFSPTVS